MLGWDAVLSALLLLNIVPGSREARFTQKSKSSGDFMVIRQGRGQMGAEGSCTGLPRPCCSIAGVGTDGPWGSCHGVLGFGEAPGCWTGTARAGGALGAVTISHCLISGSLF